MSELFGYIQSGKASPKADFQTNIKILAKYPQLKLNLQKTFKDSREEEPSLTSQSHITKLISNGSHTNKGIDLL